MLETETKKTNCKSLLINPKEFTNDTYVDFCRLYMIERMHEVTPINTMLDYKTITRLINSFEYSRWLKLINDTEKIVFINKIYNLCMAQTNGIEHYSREFLYDHLTYLATMYPSLNRGSE